MSPIYEFKCESCGDVDEVRSPTAVVGNIDLSKLKALGCKACGGVARRVYSSFSFVVK